MAGPGDYDALSGDGLHRGGGGDAAAGADRAAAGDRAGPGPVPYLPRGTGARPPGGLAVELARPALRTRVVIEARLAEDGQVASAVWLGGSLLCERSRPLPAEVVRVWGALRLPPVAAGRVAEAGRRLAAVLLDPAASGCWRGWWTGCRRVTPLKSC